MRERGGRERETGSERARDNWESYFINSQINKVSDRQPISYYANEMERERERNKERGREREKGEGLLGLIS